MSDCKTFSEELKFVNPQAHDTKLVINKKIKNLESLRRDFKPSGSSVLGQVKDFLPRLAAANADLQKQVETDPLSVNIEHVPQTDQFVEMNIALVEQTSDDSDTSDSSDSEDDIHIGEVTVDNIKLPAANKNNGKVLIETCTDSDQTEASGDIDTAKCESEIITGPLDT